MRMVQLANSSTERVAKRVLLGFKDALSGTSESLEITVLVKMLGRYKHAPDAERIAAIASTIRLVCTGEWCYYEGGSWNQIPDATIEGFRELEGGAELLDRMMKPAGEIEDFATILGVNYAEVDWLEIARRIANAIAPVS